MQTHVFIDNYRGFSKTVIPLTQVNFLVGENSTGKTSFLELLDVFSDVSFWILEPRYSAPGERTRHFLDLVSTSSKNKKTFTIGAIGPAKIQPNKDDSYCGMLVTYMNDEGRPTPCRVTIIQKNHAKTIVSNSLKNSKTETYKIRECALNAENLSAGILQLAEKHESNIGLKEWKPKSELSAAPLFYRFQDFLFPDEGYSEHEHQAPYPFMSRFVELAPIRTKPRRTYDAPQTAFSPEGEHTPYVIKKRLSSKAQAESFKEFLNSAGEQSGLFKSIEVKSYGSGPMAPFELRVVLGRSSLGVENVGYGVSQALPVLVEVFVRPKNTAFTIQQPEVHLHPKAQATFGDVLAELSRADSKKFFVETHSDFTIDRFRLNIRKNGYIPSQLLFFERISEGNIVYTISVNKDGSLPDSQPEAYREFFFNESLSHLS